MKIKLTTKNKEEIVFVEENLGDCLTTIHIEAYSKFLISLNPALQALLIEGITKTVESKKASEIISLFLEISNKTGLEYSVIK